MTSRKARIVDLKTYVVAGGISNWLFVKLLTDEGITGVGEATLEGQSNTVCELIHTLKDPFVIGQSVFDIELVVSSIWRKIFWRGGPVLMSAISGIEIAMWDAIGKLVEQPIHNLLGGRCTASVRAYANGWYRTVDDPVLFADEAREVIAQGYTALKFDPLGGTHGSFTPDGLRTSVEAVRAVREAVGEDVDVLIDTHGRLRPSESLRFLKAIEPYHPFWYEEPVSGEVLERLNLVRRTTATPIALGERFYTRGEYRRFFRSHYADVVQPDVGHSGGILEGKKISAMAEAEDTTVAPHTGNGPIITAASLQLDACIPNVLIQETFEDFDHPTMRRELFSGLPRVVNGMLSPSDKPGLGLEFNEDACAKYPGRPERGRGTGVNFDPDWPRKCWQED